MVRWKGLPLRARKCLVEGYWPGQFIEAPTRMKRVPRFFNSKFATWHFIVPADLRAGYNCYVVDHSIVERLAPINIELRLCRRSTYHHESRMS